MAIARAEMGDADRQKQNAKTRKHKVKARTEMSDAARQAYDAQERKRGAQGER